MKIMLITGSYPPNICGVGDYTKLLSDSLIEQGAEVTVYNTQSQGWSSLFKTRFLQDYDLIHMQYPTIGFGKSLIPHLFIMFCKKPNIVTLHEFSQVNILRRLSILLFKLSSNTSFIFTNEFELQKFGRSKNDETIIPIGSNIPSSQLDIEKTNSVINFGLIRPEKGIETFIDLVREAREKNISQFEFIIAGLVDVRFQAFFDEIKSACEELDIQLVLNLSDLEVADLLKKTKYAYLPYPDGASDRRGSMFAAMANDCLVLTTQGDHTSSKLMSSVVFTESASDALTQLTALDQGDHKTILQNALGYVQQFNWQDIARKHIDFYKSVIGEK